MADYRSKLEKGLEQVEDQLFAKVKGRDFGSWITGRTSGYSAGDLIENPIYVIESLYRDEIFVERQLSFTGKVNNTTFAVSSLRVAVDDYYNGAIVTNLTNQGVDTIVDYVGATKRIVTANSHVEWLNTDNIVISNIQGSRLDTTSIDAIGNTTNGSRKDLKFAKVIDKKVDAGDLIDQILKDSFVIRVTTNGAIRFVAIEQPESVGDAVFSNPVKANGEPKLYQSFTSLEDIYTDFTLRYRYDYGRKDFTKELYVNPYGYTSTVDLSAQQTACLNAGINYKILRKKFEYETDLINDDATALWLLKKIISMRTTQRMLIDYTGDAKNHIKYEEGDIVAMQHSLLPVVLYGAAFMIKSVQPNFALGCQDINFQLEEMPVNV